MVRTPVKPRGPALVSFLGRLPDRSAELRGLAGTVVPAMFPPVPGYGRVPVGNGHAAAGFSAVRAPGVAAVDGGATRAPAIVATGLALGLAACFAFFFLPAFFFFLADFFLPAAFFLPAFFDAFFFFFDAFFFFFFFPPFFAFFFAIVISFQGCLTTKKPGAAGPDYPTAGVGFPSPAC